MTFRRRLLPSAAAAALAALPSLATTPLAAGAETVTEIRITTPPGQMKYDRKVIVAKPGEKLKLVFENLDEMPHNIVFCKPVPDKEDAGLEVAQEAWKMGAEGMEKGWIPAHPRIFAHSALVEAHKTEELLLTAPEEPGVYPYVCTFPGHAMAMNGELRVMTQGPPLQDLSFKLYLGEWTSMPDFDKVKPHREGPLPESLVDIKLEGYTQAFGARYDGFVEAPKDGNYRFFLASDDGAKLYIDGREVINNDGIHPSSEVKTGRVRLTAGRHAFRIDYFEYNGEEQLYAGWQGPGFSHTPLSKWVHPSRENGGAGPGSEDPGTGIPLVPVDTPLIYRNFIAGSSPRGIAVGYPNGANFCFDADQMSLAMIWRGAFIDAKRHWTDRGSGTQPPLGFDVMRPAPDGPTVALLETPQTPWPEKKGRAEGIRFRGYKLDANRSPVFRYDLGSVIVEDAWKAEGNYRTNDARLVRTLRFTAPQPPAGLYVRAAKGALKESGGVWTSQDGYRVVPEAGKSAPVLRGGTELILPVTFTDTTASVTVTYEWVN